MDYNRNYKIIFCVFGGREKNMNILQKYIEKCLEWNIIDEYHIMNFSRNIKDWNYLKTSFERFSELFLFIVVNYLKFE